LAKNDLQLQNKPLMFAHGFLLLESWAEESAGRFLTTAPASSLTCELRPLRITERVTYFAKS